MPELAPPLTQSQRATVRLEGIAGMWAQRARLDAELRWEIAALACEDTPSGTRTYLCDELGLALAESPGTADRLIDSSLRCRDHPAVLARVGQPIQDGGWSMRHADALLDAIAGLGLTREVQQQVVDLVADHPDALTPHHVRKAAHAAVMVLDPEGAERRLSKARANRRVGADTLSDGSASFWAAGTASQIASVMASIDCLAGPKQPGDQRTLDQRRFDAFMDLICGRAIPGQWQALVVVALETLTGQSEQPAEIPGFGLIPASEARDLVARAELRRAVLDEHGQLLSIDSQLHRPDLQEIVSLQEPHPDHGLSLQIEPEPLDLSPEQQPTDADLTWLQHEHDLTETLRAMTSTLEAELTALLAAHTPAPVSARAASAAGPTVHEHPPWIPIEITGWHHDPGPGPGPDGPDGPDGPEPEPPSLADQQWADDTVDRDAQDALEPPPRYQREPWTPHPRASAPAPRRTGWTLTALHAALTKIRTHGMDPRPLSSTAYTLPPRLARFVKHRDLTCSFPGCRRPARDSQNDHLHPWPWGASSPDNIDSKCTHHHQAKTHGGYHTHRLPDGTIRWTTPLNRIYDRHPRPLLRGF